MLNNKEERNLVEYVTTMNVADFEVTNQIHRFEVGVSKAEMLNIISDAISDRTHAILPLTNGKHVLAPWALLEHSFITLDTEVFLNLEDYDA